MFLIMDTLPSFGVTLVSLIAFMCFIHSDIAKSKVPQSVPWVGIREEVLSETRACIREFKAGLRTLKSGYDQVFHLFPTPIAAPITVGIAKGLYLQFSRKGLPFVSPSPEFRPIVIVPPEHIAWMSDKPEHVLSARRTQVPMSDISQRSSLGEDMLTLRSTQAGRFAIDYLCPSLDYNHDAFMIGAARKDLTRNLGRMQPDMIGDIHSTIDKAMGLDNCYWKEVCITQVMEEVVFKSTSRALVGSPLCTNEHYIRYLIAFATWLGGCAILVGQYVPWIMKPPIGYLAALPIYYYKQQAMKFLVPVVRDRMANIKRKRADPSFNFEEPKDLLTWTTQAALDDPETKYKPPEFLALHLLFFVSTVDGRH